MRVCAEEDYRNGKYKAVEVMVGVTEENGENFRRGSVVSSNPIHRRNHIERSFLERKIERTIIPLPKILKPKPEWVNKTLTGKLFQPSPAATAAAHFVRVCISHIFSSLLLQHLKI